MACGCAPVASLKAQGFASAAPIVILFEENVYCGDSCSAFFTVLWINRFQAPACACMCNASYEPASDCWTIPQQQLPQAAARAGAVTSVPRAGRLQPKRRLMPPCPLPAVRSMRTCFLKSVEAPTSALVYCTCNARTLHRRHKAAFHLQQVPRCCGGAGRHAAAAGQGQSPCCTLRPAQSSPPAPQFASSYVFVKRFLADAGSRVQLLCSNLSQLLLDAVPTLVPPPPVTHS